MFRVASSGTSRSFGRLELGNTSWSNMNQRNVIYQLGDMVRIKAGPFAAFSGKIEGINQSKSLLKVRIEIFGRVTPIKVSFSEAEKLEFQQHSPPGSTK